MWRSVSRHPRWIAVVFFLCAFSNFAFSSAPRVWFSDHNALRAIDTDTNQITFTLPRRHEPTALAVNPSDQSLWVVSQKYLEKYNSNGARLVEIDFTRLGHQFQRPRFLVANPYSGAAWVASEHQLVSFSATGERLAQWRSHQDIEGLQLDLDESVWVLSRHRLVHLSASANVLAAIDLEDDLREPEHLAVDSLGGVIWVASDRRLLRLDLNHPDKPARRINLPTYVGDPDHREIRALDVHPVFGTLWLATRRHLVLFDRAGNHLKTVDLPRSLGKTEALAFDPLSLSLWLAGEEGVARFTSSGELVATIAADKEAEHLGVSRFALRPTLSIIEPANGLHTNNSRPPFRLSLGADCSGTPCLLPQSYVQSLNLNVWLNSTDVGSLFMLSGTEAQYFPATRLPEGLNRVRASATDAFGHASTEVQQDFVIDTIAPAFTALTPVDGSTVNNASIIISGAVDDTSASVILADANGNGISMAGATFSFAVTLKAGLNSFVLTARDAAGNEAKASLRISYNAVSVKIKSPIVGATLTQRGVLISGDFQGPTNTGIAVNGVPAQVIGNYFYATLSLSPGTNTVTATATTPEGASVTDTVTVTVNASATDSIEVTANPASGIAPLNVRFEAKSNTAKAIAKLAFDFDNNGSVDATYTGASQLIERMYSTVGVHETRIIATDVEGVITQQTVSIVVMDGEQMDRLFTALWGGMNEALVRGDIAAASATLNDAAKRKYQPVFEALKPHFPQIIASYSPLQRVSITSDIGEYAVVRNQNGQNRLYLIYFLQDEDGVWRLDGM